MKEYNELKKKSGSQRYSALWASASGKREYALVTHHAKWAELDPLQDPKLKDVRGQVATLVARIRNSVESSRRVLLSLEADLSLPSGNEPPPLIRVIHSFVRPEHNNAYRALIKSELLPAARKSGLKVWGTSRVRYGGSAYEYDIVSAVENWAELDREAPMITAMGGASAYEKFLTKLLPMISGSEYEMFRLLKDQSYLRPSQ